MKNNLLFLAFATFLVQVSFVYSQADHATNVSGSAAFQAEPLGWLSGTANDVEILNTFSSKSINLSTFNGSLIKRMTILSTGEVGIGSFTPAYLLDVNGDIDINVSSSGLRLKDNVGSNNYYLRNNGLRENIYLGFNAGNNFSEYNNTLLGYYCGSELHSGGGTDSWNNTFVGSFAGAGDYSGHSYGRYGYNNVGVGVSALESTDAYGGTAVGYRAAAQNKTGCSITAMGENTMNANTAGNDNCAFGYDAMLNNTELSDNVALGAEALYTQNWAPQSGTCSYDAHNIYQTGCKSSYNVAVGNSALYFNNPVGASTDPVNGIKNSAFGFAAMYSNTTGYANTGIGYSSGYSNQTGNNLTFLGFQSDVCPTCSSLVNSTAIGANTIITVSNEVILGGNTIGGAHAGFNEVNVGIGLSNDPIGPQSKLEINADPASTSAGSTIRGSGLQFRQLTDIDIPSPNTGPGLLSVDANGVVVYVDQIGNYCGADIPSPLMSSFEIPLGRQDYYFSGQGIAQTDVIVGFSCFNPIPAAKFQSYQLTTQGTTSYGGEFYNGTDDKIAEGVIGISPLSKNRNIGVEGQVREYKGKTNYGVLGQTIAGANLLAGNMNVGVYGYANLRPAPTSTHLNLAVVGDLGPTVVPLLGTGGDFAGYFNGDVGTTAGSFMLSDSTLKENISDIINPMDVLNALNPKSYTFKQQGNESMILPIGTHFGVLAQNLETVLPTAVKECIHPARYDTLGNQTHAEIDYKAVNNMEIIPFLIAAVKEQQQTIDAMQAQLSNCCGGGNRNSNTGGEHGNSTSLDVELKNAKSIILNQNVPNPFAEQTTISFFLTDDVKKAQIFFYDNKGVILKIVDINEKGAGQLNVYAADLSSGSYTYSLIADGKLIETKKMVKTN